MSVLVVGGGPAGAVLAIHLARAGVEVVLTERSPTYRWRACGVFSSPAALGPLRAAGLSAGDLARVSRPIPAMRLETPSGELVRLTYGAEAGAGAGIPAVSSQKRTRRSFLDGTYSGSLGTGAATL